MPTPPVPDQPPAERRRVGFLGHALAEYVLGAALIAAGIHLSGGAGTVLLAVGAVLVALNASTRGPLGAFSLVGRKAHHVADLVLVALLACSPLLAFSHLHLLGIAVAEAVALVLLRIERRTRYEPGTPKRGAAPVAHRSGPDPSETSPKGVRAAETAGRLAGTALPGAARLAEKGLVRGARGLGVLAGATRRTLRQRGDRDRAGSSAAGTGELG